MDKECNSRAYTVRDSMACKAEVDKLLVDTSLWEGLLGDKILEALRCIRPSESEMEDSLC